MARSFTGSSDKIALTPTQPPNAGSISFWLKPNFNSGDSTDHIAFEWANSTTAPTNALNFDRYLDNNLYVGWFTGGTDNRIVVADTGLFSAGVWANHVFTWDNSAGQKYYLNGVQKGSNVTTSFVATVTTQCTVGNSGLVLLGGINGAIADFDMWTVVLSAGEISALSNGVRPNAVRGGPTRLWLPLDGQQSPEPDLSGNANNGMLTGTALAPGPPINLFTPRWPQTLASSAAPPSAPLFRRTLSRLGTRSGSRQTRAA